MRFTEPTVSLVARPEINWDELSDYILSTGAAADNDENMPWSQWATDHIMDQTSDGELLSEAFGRMCYRSWEEGLNPNVRKVRKDTAQYLTNILRSGHGSVLEHANYSFTFHHVSRVFTHELVRHRAGSAFSQESMRFVRLDDIPMWIPEWAKEDRELMNYLTSELHRAEEFQTWMSQHFGLDDDGVDFHIKKEKTSFMRRFAPGGVATDIAWTANIRTLRHVIEQRTAPGAEEEMRMVFGKVARIMIKEAPLLFGDFEDVNGDGKWYRPEFRKV